MRIYGNKHIKYLIWRLVLKKPKVRRWLQRAIYGTGTREVSLIGHPMTVSLDEEIGYFRAARLQDSAVVFTNDVPHLISLFSFLDKDHDFIDAGANIGLWTVLASKTLRLHGGGKVYSFEANADTFSRLSINTKLLPNVVAFQLALSDKSEVLTFYKGGASSVFGVVRGPFNTDDIERLEAVPLDAVDTGRRRLVVKIDVEGHEAPVLAGMVKTLERVDALYIDGVSVAQSKDVINHLKDFKLFDAHTGSEDIEWVEHVRLLATRRVSRS